MSEQDEHETVAAAFAAFRRETLPMVKPAGLTPARVRRRNGRLGVLATAVGCVAVIVVAVVAGPGRSGPDAVVTPVLSPSPIPSPIPSSRPSPATASPSSPPKAEPTCTVAQLTTQPGTSGATANQPFEIVRIVNRSSKACSLRGYPRVIDVRGTGPNSTRSVPTPITATDTSTFVIPDPGVHTATLAPHGVASFAIGTSTAFESPIRTLRSARIVLPGGSASIPVSLSIDATAPAGRPIPIFITAITSGPNAGTILGR